jgi:hypothetical protein
MSRRWLGVLVSIVVTTLSVLTMSGLGFGVVLDLTTDSAALPCAEVPGIPQAFEDDRHIPYEGAAHEPYRSRPPTSGPHSPRILAPGIYWDQVPEELQVHALEHGHILAQYAPDVSEADIAALEALGRKHLRDVIVAPYPALEHGIALTGWQRLQRFDRLDAAAVEEFITKVADRYDHGWRDGATDCIG